MASSSSSVFIIGLSGPSSAGKTTLAHLLSRVFFPSVIHILHGDDFCKELKDLPTVNGYLDADGPDGVDFVRMVQVLDYIKANAGKTPTDFKSWQADVFPGQDQKALGLVEEQLLSDLHKSVKTCGVDFRDLILVIVEGFMLYNVQAVQKKLDAKLFIRLSYAEAKCRRMAKQSYGADAKPEQFWKTEGYFEKMVWRNYATAHASFFKDQDVEGAPDAEKCAAAGVNVQPGLNVDVGTTLHWTTNVILNSLKHDKK